MPLKVDVCSECNKAKIKTKPISNCKEEHKPLFEGD
jgi:hypothetical protein